MNQKIQNIKLLFKVLGTEIFGLIGYYFQQGLKG